MVGVGVVCWARHCWTLTTQGVHKVMDVVLLPVELMLLDDEGEQGEDRLYLAETVKAEAAADAAGDGEGGVGGDAEYVFGTEWELYEQPSKVRAVRAAERLCEEFVMTRMGRAKRTVFVNDSEISRDTARFMQTFTPFEFNPQTVSASTPRHHPRCRLIVEAASQSMFSVCVLVSLRVLLFSCL